jgi:hypothetical protein
VVQKNFSVSAYFSEAEASPGGGSKIKRQNLSHPFYFAPFAPFRGHTTILPLQSSILV